MQTSYETFKLKDCNVAVIAEWHFLELLKVVKRRLIFRQKFTNPWIINITENIHNIPVYQAVRDHTLHYNIHFTVKWDRIGNGEKYSIYFQHLGELIFHLSKITNITKLAVKEFLHKAGMNDRTAEVVVSDEKTFSIEYDVKKSKLTVNCTIWWKINTG